MPTYIEGFEIDAVLNEERTSECEVTEHPVEKGVSVTDHARLKPKVISLDCIVSDTPVGGLAERRKFQNSILAITGLQSVPSDLARTYIEELQAKRKTVTVSTEWSRTDGTKGYKAYDNMMITSISETVSADSGDTYSFKVMLKQIVYVENERTIVKVSTPRAKKKVDKGEKACEEVKKAPEEVESWAYTGYHAGKKMFGF